MKGHLRHARLLRFFALGAFGFGFLLFLAPSMRATPAPPRVRPATADSAAGALLQFASQGHVLGFREGEFYASNATYAMRVEFVDANLVAPMSNATFQPDQRVIPPLNRVAYPDLWDGITLAYDAPPGGVVSSSYRVDAGADPRSIHLRYNAPVVLNSDGTLTIAYATGEMRESAPVAWQEVEGVRIPVAAMFAPDGDREVGFAVGEYDATQPLLIDPKLTWNTFLGGGGNDFGSAIAVDGSGYVYVAGSSTATWQGVTAPVRAYTGGLDAFVAKLSSSGALMWNTFLGDSGDDIGDAIAVDGNGNVYVAGYSTATWQGAAAPVRAHGLGTDAYAAKLNSNGALTWNTFLGGSLNDYGNAIAVDAGGNVYVAGSSFDTWQGTSPPVRMYSSTGDAFAAKLNSSGALTWNTFLGGSGTDAGSATAVDADGNVYVAGYSAAMWQGATGPTRDYSGGNDAFAAKLSSSGALTWNCFLGGSGSDLGYGTAVDGRGLVYVSGASTAAWQDAAGPVRAYTGGYDAYVARIGEFGVYLPLMIK